MEGEQTKRSHNAMRMLAGLFAPNLHHSYNNQHCGYPATALLCMNEQGGRRIQAWDAKRAARSAIRVNANDPSACTALSSGHILGTDGRLFNGVWAVMGK